VHDAVDAGDFLVLGDPEAHRLLDDEADDQGEDEGVDEDGERPDDLPPELVDPTAVEQPVDAGRGGRRGEQADLQGAPQAADQVHADDVE
jgi:hypothetical protein